MEQTQSQQQVIPSKIKNIFFCHNTMPGICQNTMPGICQIDKHCMLK